MLLDRIRREAQVEERGEHRADHVAHDQEPLAGQKEAHLRGRVARGLDHLEVPERSRDPGSLAQRLVGDQVAVDAVRLLANVRHLRHDRLRHPEPAGEALALGAVPLGVAEGAEEVLALRRCPDPAARALRHSRRGAEVVGVEVGDHQIAHVGQPPAACRPARARPPRARSHGRRSRRPRAPRTRPRRPARRRSRGLSAARGSAGGAARAPPPPPAPRPPTCRRPSSREAGRPPQKGRSSASVELAELPAAARVDALSACTPRSTAPSSWPSSTTFRVSVAVTVASLPVSSSYADVRDHVTALVGLPLGRRADELDHAASPARTVRRSPRR